MPRSTVVDFAATGWKYLTFPQTDDATFGPATEDTTYAGFGYDDSTWTVGQAAFGWGYHGGVGFTPRNTTLTEQDEVWIRRQLPGGCHSYVLTIRVDNWAFVYFNGHRLDGPGRASPYLPGAYWSGADDGAPDHSVTVPQTFVRNDRNIVALHVLDQLGDTGGGATGYGPGDVFVADMQITAIPGQPRLRQFPRDDALGHAPRPGRQSTSVQATARQGWIGTYR